MVKRSLYLGGMINSSEQKVAIHVRPFDSGYSVKLVFPDGCEVSNYFRQRYLIYDWIDFLKIKKYEISWET